MALTIKIAKFVKWLHWQMCLLPSDVDKLQPDWLHAPSPSRVDERKERGFTKSKKNAELNQLQAVVLDNFKNVSATVHSLYAFGL